MFTPSPDYLQQLLAYLQAGQQLLQQWASLAGGSPPAANSFMPPAASAVGQPVSTTPFPAQPAPSAPDYAQQLFSYLQAWRQHLEQLAGTSPGSAQTSAAAPFFGGGGQTAHLPHHGGGSDIPTKPDDNAGSKSNMLKDQSSGPTPPPEVVAVGPALRNSSQAPGSEQPQILIPPFMDIGNQVDRLGQEIPGVDSVASPVRAAAARQRSDTAIPQRGTAFQSAINRLGPASVQPIRAQTLFSQGFDRPSG